MNAHVSLLKSGAYSVPIKSALLSIAVEFPAPKLETNAYVSSMGRGANCAYLEMLVDGACHLEHATCGSCAFAFEILREIGYNASSSTFACHYSSCFCEEDKKKLNAWALPLNAKTQPLRWNKP